MNNTQIEGKSFYETTDEFDGCKILYVRKQLLEKYPKDETLKSGVPFIAGTSKDLREYYRVEPGDKIQFRLVLRTRLDDATKNVKIAKKTPLRKVAVRNIPVEAVRVKDEAEEETSTAMRQQRVNTTRRSTPKIPGLRMRDTKAIPSGVAAWAINNTHGKVNDGSGYKFCALHVQFNHPSDWLKHIKCASIGSRPNAAYLVMKRLPAPKKKSPQDDNNYEWSSSLGAYMTGRRVPRGYNYRYNVAVDENFKVLYRRSKTGDWVKVGGKKQQTPAEVNRIETMRRTKYERKMVKKTKKPKRTSKLRRICSKHGKFIGYAWCGHRRLCKAPEVSLAAARAMVKRGEKALKEAPAKTKNDVIWRVADRIKKFENDLEVKKKAFFAVSAEEKTLRNDLENKAKEVADARTVYQKAAGDLTELVKSINSTLD